MTRKKLKNVVVSCRSVPAPGVGRDGPPHPAPDEALALFRASALMQRGSAANAAVQWIGEGDVVKGAILDTHARLLDMVEEDLKTGQSSPVMVEEL